MEDVIEGAGEEQRITAAQLKQVNPHIGGLWV